MDFEQAALEYIRIGWKVLPLRPGTKEAFIGRGVYDATDNIDAILNWSTNYPNANIAAACEPSNMTVLDVDKHHGGVETLKKLTAIHGQLANAPMQQTPRGGFHIFFALDRRLTNSTGDKGRGLGAGLDLKTKGAYITLAPSRWDGMQRGNKIHEGGAYKWIRAPRGTALPVLPNWIVAKLAPKPKAPFSKKQIDHGDADVAQIEKALGFIPNENYDVWIRMGMALKKELGDNGLALWLNWSHAGYKDFKAVECEAKWKSFKRGDGVSIGSLFHEARAAGADMNEIFNERGKL